MSAPAEERDKSLLVSAGCAAAAEPAVSNGLVSCTTRQDKAECCDIGRMVNIGCLDRLLLLIMSIVMGYCMLVSLLSRSGRSRLTSPLYPRTLFLIVKEACWLLRIRNHVRYLAAAKVPEGLASES